VTFAPPKLLTSILSLQRKGRGQSEREFINKHLLTLDPRPKVDKHGNYWVRVNNKDGSDPNILWSTHTDTVHHKDGTQMLIIHNGIMKLADPKVGICLGADDGAGLYLAIEMIRSGVPGLYIFHRDEESGGKGSQYIKTHHKDKLKNIKFAIALDRKGYSSIITHQFGGTCCSDEFGKQLGSLLGTHWKLDPTGTFTDTANYTGIIPECTNISVGYFDQHGPKETLDVGFLVQLKNKLTTIDFSVLEAHRDPTAKPSYTDFSRRGSHKGGYYGYDDYDDYYTAPPKRSVNHRSSYTPPKYKFGTLERFVEDHPDFVAAWLEEFGVDLRMMEDDYYEAMGWLPKKPPLPPLLSGPTSDKAEEGEE
jgi:hypothetical protein